MIATSPKPSGAAAISDSGHIRHGKASGVDEATTALLMSIESENAVLSTREEAKISPKDLRCSQRHRGGESMGLRGSLAHMESANAQEMRTAHASQVNGLKAQIKTLSYRNDTLRHQNRAAEEVQKQYEQAQDAVTKEQQAIDLKMTTIDLKRQL